MTNEAKNYFRVGSRLEEADANEDFLKLRDRIEPWLAALLQSEHLSLLVGNGLTTALAHVAGVTAPSMGSDALSEVGGFRPEEAARRAAIEVGRAEPNVEDRIRVLLAVLGGLEVIGTEEEKKPWRALLDTLLTDLVKSVLGCERLIRDEVRASSDKGLDASRALVSFLLTFASRATSRERLNVFTTNYDRLLEYGCDLAGLRPLDRFVGSLEPVFRASRLDVDVHYNPPGIRGEPRYLEGVVRLSKLHGSLDWQWREGSLVRASLPFGAADDHPGVPSDLSEALMIYPNPAKDLETTHYPYSELFRDFSAAVSRPNSALVTYGYGFGDEHINRNIADMLTIPSTHLLVISYDDARGRVSAFLDSVGRESQISLLIGPKFAELKTLIDLYLPKPAIDRVTERAVDLKRRRGIGGQEAVASDVVDDA